MGNVWLAEARAIPVVTMHRAAQIPSFVTAILPGVNHALLGSKNVAVPIRPAANLTVASRAVGIKARVRARVLVNIVALRIMRSAVIPSIASILRVRTALLKVMIVETITSLAVQI